MVYDLELSTRLSNGGRRVSKSNASDSLLRRMSARPGQWVTLRGMSTDFHARALSAALTVKDLEKSLAWYRDVIGFAVDQRHEREGVLRAVSLKAGDVQILIGLDDGAKGWDRVK